MEGTLNHRPDNINRVALHEKLRQVCHQRASK